MATAKLALVGDRSPSVRAHGRIPLLIEALRTREGLVLDPYWIPSTEADDLQAFDGIWVVPGSPYTDPDKVVAAVRTARERQIPFLGTCGGFQHALLDYAEAMWDVRAPAHAELDPDAADPVIAPLICGLVEQTGDIRFEPGSRLEAIYGRAETVEGYHCRYGLNPAYAARLDAGPLRVAARDAAGEVRAVELDGHPFFVATLFQPQVGALAGQPLHPLIDAFAEAARGLVHR